MAIYLVSYDVSNVKERDALNKQLAETFGDALRIMGSAWLVSSDTDADSICNLFMSCLKDLDIHPKKNKVELIVVEIFSMFYCYRLQEFKEEATNFVHKNQLSDVVNVITK